MPSFLLHLFYFKCSIRQNFPNIRIFQRCFCKNWKFLTYVFEVAFFFIYFEPWQIFFINSNLVSKGGKFSLKGTTRLACAIFFELTTNSSRSGQLFWFQWRNHSRLFHWRINRGYLVYPDCWSSNIDTILKSPQTCHLCFWYLIHDSSVSRFS